MALVTLGWALGGPGPPGLGFLLSFPAHPLSLSPKLTGEAGTSVGLRAAENKAWGGGGEWEGKKNGQGSSGLDLPSLLQK